MPTRALQDRIHVDDLDRALVGALQLDPRATWTELGRQLDVDPATATRRWQRLHEAGAAWISCYPLFTQGSVAALVEIDCEAGMALRVAADLASDPEALFVAVASGSRDLIMTAVCEDPSALATYLLQRVSSTPGVRHTTSHPVVTVHASGDGSPIGSLIPGKRTSFSPRATGIRLSAYEPDELDWALADELSRDGRLPIPTLASALGVGEPTVRRRLSGLLSSGSLRLAAGIASPAFGYPVFAWYFLRLPANQVSAVTQSLNGLPQLVSATSYAGPCNLIILFALESIEQVHALEARLVDRIPNLVVVDRAVERQVMRRLGRLLGSDGHAKGVTSIRRRTAPR